MSKPAQTGVKPRIPATFPGQPEKQPIFPVDRSTRFPARI